MKDKLQERKEDVTSAIFAIIAIIVIILLAFVFMPMNNFDNSDKYEVKKYYVGSGDTAWSIYKETCPNANWSEWQRYVEKTNENVDLEHLYPGQVLIIPFSK